MCVLLLGSALRCTFKTLQDGNGCLKPILVCVSVCVCVSQDGDDICSALYNHKLGATLHFPSNSFLPHLP